MSPSYVQQQQHRQNNNMMKMMKIEHNNANDIKDIHISRTTTEGAKPVLEVEELALNEVEACIDFIMCKIELPNIVRGDASKFLGLKSSFKKVLMNKYQGHWDAEQPTKGSGFRCLEFLPNKLDKTLAVAIRASLGQFNPEQLVKDCGNKLKCEIRVWVDPGEVSYRYNNGSVVSIFQQVPISIPAELSPKAEIFTPKFSPPQQRRVRTHSVSSTSSSISTTSSASTSSSGRNSPPSMMAKSSNLSSLHHHHHHHHHHHTHRQQQHNNNNNHHHHHQQQQQHFQHQGQQVTFSSNAPSWHSPPQQHHDHMMMMRGAPVTSMLNSPFSHPYSMGLFSVPPPMA